MKGSTLTVLDQALDVLGNVASASNGLTMSEISELMGLSRSSAHRYLVTLEAHGLLQRDPDTDKYLVGLAILEFASKLQRNTKLLEIGGPALKRLNNTTDETSGLHVVSNDSRICLMQAESSQPIRYVYDIGIPRKLTAGGAESKVLLAFNAKALGDPAGTFPARSVGRGQRSTFAEIRAQGYATSIDELGLAAAAVAAPVYNRDGVCTAALSIVMPITRMSPSRLEEFAKPLCGEAQTLSGWLGHHT